MEVSPEPRPKGLWGPIQGHKESSARSVLTRSIVLSFPPRQLQDPEHTKVEHEGEQARAKCWVPQDESPETGLGPGPKAGLRPPVW